MFKPKTKEELILHRFKIAQGHLNKVIQMVEGGEYCIDVIHQSQAVQRAMAEADNAVLENHLNTCAREKIQNGEAKTAIDELMHVFRKRAR